MDEEKTIIILGTGESCRWCDFNWVNGEKIPNSEVWGVNGAYTTRRILPRKYKKYFCLDKLFLTDFLFTIEGSMNFLLKELNDLRHQHGCELFSMRNMELGKDKLECRLIPYRKICDYFGLGQKPYFSDTITYMIAYALYTHSELGQLPNGVIRPELTCPLTLRLFGIDMCTNIEYQVSKGGVEFWLGIAKGMGCTITVAYGSAILQNPRPVPYGFRPKIDLNLIDPENILGRRRKKKKPTLKDMIRKKYGRPGDEKIRNIMLRFPKETVYQNAR